MATRCVAVAHVQEPSVPLRRSSRLIRLPTTNAGPSILNSRPEAPLVATRRTNNRPPNPSTTTTTITPPNPPPATRKRSRAVSGLQDEPEVEVVDAEPLPRLRLRRRQRAPTIIVPSPTHQQQQQEPTSRAIRAQKRRKIADEARDKVTTTATSLSQTPSSTSASLPLSLPASRPNPISPEPISPTIGTSPAYIMKARVGKRKVGEFDKEGSSSSGLTSEATGDPLPRSLTKRRKIATIAPPPGTMREKSRVPTTTTKTTVARTRQKAPQGINAVRRSARLQAASSSSSSQSADAPKEPPAMGPVASADAVHDAFLIPMSPLTPLPDDETPTPSPEPETRPEHPPPSLPLETVIEEPEPQFEQPSLPPSSEVPEPETRLEQPSLSPSSEPAIEPRLEQPPLPPSSEAPEPEARPEQPSLTPPPEAAIEEPETGPEQPPLTLASEAAIEEPELRAEQPSLPPPSEAVEEPSGEGASASQEAGPAEPELASNEPPHTGPPTELNGEVESDQEDEDDMEMVASIDILLAATEPPTPAAAAKFRTIIPGHLSRPILKGRSPPNPLLFHQYQLAAYSRAKPNTPSPLSLYSFTGNSPPSSPTLSATTTIEALDDIPLLDPSAAAAFVEAEAAIFGAEQYAQFSQQPFFQQPVQYDSASTSGYVQEGQPQAEQQALEPQAYEQPGYQQQQPQAGASASQPIFDMNLMMEFLQLQQMQMAAAAGMAAGFGVGAEANHIPATVNMQDVHLHQQPHAGQPQSCHQHFGQDTEFGFTGFFGQPADQFGAYDPPQQHVANEFGQQSETQQQQYLGAVQEFAQYGQFQHEYQEQPQQSALLGYEVYSPAEHQIYDAPQVVQAYGQQQQQHFQPQHVDVNAFASSSGYDGYTGQASPAGTSASASVDNVATTSHYTLAMHRALMYFQQTLARFHEQQLIAKQEAEQAHVHQLFDFQREKEEKKRKLKMTRLITQLETYPMSQFTAYRSKTLWPLACKARMWEVARRYSPDLIREETELSARDYHRRMGLRYPYPQRRRRRRRVARVHQVGTVDDGMEVPPLPASPIDAEGLEDEDEFRNEKIFDFELLDDDDEDMDIEEMKKLMEVDHDEEEEDDDDGDVEMDDDEESSLDDEEDDDDDDEDSEEEPSSEADCDPEGTTNTDPLFDPELCMQVQPQGASSSSGIHQSAFYVPPPALMQVPVSQGSVNSQQPSTQNQTPNTSPSAPVVSKLMVVQRPILSLPPPLLSTLRPQALKNQNMEPMVAGQGTPSIRVRRELWAGGPLPSFPVIQDRSSDVDQASASVSVDDANAATTSTEVANCDNEDTGSTPTLVRQMTEESSSATCAHPVDESAVSVVAHGEAEIGPEDAISGADSDTEFGDCPDTCCMSEKALGKRRAVEEEGGGGGVVQGTDGGFEDFVDGAPRDHDAGLTSTPNLPQIPAAPSPSEHETLHQTTMHQTVVLTPAISDQIPLRRRAVSDRDRAVLKVQAPPTKPAPSMLPVARRPPRPFPPDEIPVFKPNGHAYHPIVPYSWEHFAEAMDILAVHGIDTTSWADSASSSSGMGVLPTLTPTIVLSGTEVQPTFYSSSSELSSALG